MSRFASIARRSAGFVLASALLPLCLAVQAVAVEDEDDEDEEQPFQPAVYLDYRTTLMALPPGVIGFGFRAAPRLQVSSEASQQLLFDFPMTIDLTETVSLYAGVSTSTSRTATTAWRRMTLDTWNVGFQADVYQQNGGWFPTVTVQSTVTRSIPSSPLSGTFTTTIGELNYAFDEDETRGLLAGVMVSNTFFDLPLLRADPVVVGYAGGYYQWDNNWKLTGRAGVQSFPGAQLLALQPIKPFTKPVLRLDLDKLDDNGNRLIGVSAELAWAPKVAFGFVLRTPLYLVKN